jgi:hypothetical protein
VAEVSERVRQLSDTQILLAFREALVALYPILQRLDCISDDSQPYDPFDRVAESLWKELVLESFRWKYGLEAPPLLPPYGFSGGSPGLDGYVEVSSRSAEPCRFIQFVGDRTLGLEPFNSVQGVSLHGVHKSVRVDEQVSFSWTQRLK